MCAYALTRKQEAHSLAHAARTGAAKAAKEAVKASKHNEPEAMVLNELQEEFCAQSAQGTPTNLPLSCYVTSTVELSSTCLRK